MKVDANEDVIQYGRRACAVRGAQELRILLALLHGLLLCCTERQTIFLVVMDMSVYAKIQKKVFWVELLQ